MAKNGRFPRPSPWYSPGLLFLAGVISGFTFSQLFRYLRRILRQPRLDTGWLLQELDDDSSIEARAVLIATANLRGGIEKRRLPDGQEKSVLCAGRRHFREPWARDLGFASFGLVEIEAYQAARESFEVFLLNQLPSGQFPVKVHSTGVLDRYLHSLFQREQPIVAPIRPKYISGHNTVSLDGNALLVIGILNYVDRSQDWDFLHTHWEALKRGVRWLETHALETDGLLHQGAFSDWADSIARKGRVLYTNVLYWKALRDMAATAAALGNGGDEAYFGARAAAVGASINAHFWQADLGYYVTNRDFNNLSSSGNLLAIAWGLADQEQAHAILAAMQQFGMADPVPTKPVFPPYPSRFVALENRLGGIGYYHIHAAWLWLGAWHVIAASQAGRMAEAAALLKRISSVIVRDGSVHEVYAPDGRFVSGFWYTSETPFTWSAGSLLYAHHVYHRQLQKAVQA